MKFGIFYELQLPRPWGPDSELTLYHNALDQLELADRLGYDFAWEVEHHFLEEYSHSPAPEVFLAAASQRTRQIRLAHGIMQLTTVHPARVAERIRRPTLRLHEPDRVQGATQRVVLGVFRGADEAFRELVTGSWHGLFGKVCGNEPLGRPRLLSALRAFCADRSPGY